MIPETITLGPHAWQVLTDHDTANYLRHDNARGTTDAQSLTIRVDVDGLAATAVRETLLHEALHACWETSGLAAHEVAEHTEQVITALAPQLLHLLRANPDLVAYLTEDPA